MRLFAPKPGLESGYNPRIDWPNNLGWMPDGECRLRVESGNWGSGIPCQIEARPPRFNFSEPRNTPVSSG